MDENTIASLRTALELSPDNVPLRKLLAETLLSLNRLDEAEIEYSTLIKTANDKDSKLGQEAGRRRGKFSKGGPWWI